ncbi:MULTISPECIES: CRISPR-associated protein Cas4 [unclassified Mesotoga]|uniref:CRISPR-associated protein Cas4 n=1 Tax=unclassified Mesotoga TaxID=1184398 RepID=UPI000C18E30D|nr:MULTISPECIES: CRISPR-associated protein Cas4 [unclassified Mesotoga]PVD17380.1 CRISPR-associated protein Cas4 [Mesotoga sp. Brook.08.105.5.1]RAO98317.1 CRISPR-associated protein Cas4 [Mesotoga sp. Brook.08.YT.4.2.5.4.]
MIEITGYLVLSYSNCAREAWLVAHRIFPESENMNLALGRLIHETSYENRGEKDIAIDNIRLDMVEEKKGRTIVSEIKKSKYSLEGARDQLLFYLLRLKEMGVEANGQLLVPKEKRKIEVMLTAEEEARIKTLCDEIQALVEGPIPSLERTQNKCKNCAYYSYCWV